MLWRNGRRGLPERRTTTMVVTVAGSNPASNYKAGKESDMSDKRCGNCGWAAGWVVWTFTGGAITEYGSCTAPVPKCVEHYDEDGDLVSAEETKDTIRKGDGDGCQCYKAAGVH